MMNASSLLLTSIVGGFIFLISTAHATDTDSCTDAQQSNGPIITPCRSEIILQTGQNYTLSCRGKNELQFTQQDIPEELVAPFFKQQRNTSSLDPDYPFETFLDLYNVDQYAVGYYACFDNTVNVSNILNNLMSEPDSTEHVSFIYIYVNGSGSLLAPMRQVILSRQAMVLIECRPTTPDVNVSLISEMAEFRITKYSPKIGYIIDGEDLVDNYIVTFNCESVTPSRWETKEIYVQKYQKPPPSPSVSGESHKFLKGETFTLNCTVPYERGLVVNLQWDFPKSITQEIRNATNEFETVTNILYRNLTIVNATKEYEGVYTCISSNSCGNKQSSFKKVYHENPYINLTIGQGNGVIETAQRSIKLHAEIDAVPPVEVKVLKDGKTINTDIAKYEMSIKSTTFDRILKIKNLTLWDTGNYTMVATNKYMSQNITFDLRVDATPNINFGPDKKRLKNTTVSLKCEVIGFPLPQITWTFSSGDKQQNIEPAKLNVDSLYKVTAYLNISVQESGNITCTGENKQGTSSLTRALLVYEIPDGFGITDPQHTRFSQNENIAIKCLASVYDFLNVTWVDSNGEILENMVEYRGSKYSYVAVLRINQISLDHAGNYTCQGTTLGGKLQQQTIPITVAVLQPPIIREPVSDINKGYFLSQRVEIHCQADGVPPPTLEWYKDNELVPNISNVEINTTNINWNTINSTIIITSFQEQNQGTYECVAKTDTGETRTSYRLTAKEIIDNTMLLSTISVVILALIVIVVYLTWKIKKEKKFRKELAAAGLLYFKEGATGSLNPERGIDEQAELLPYDDKFEFPAEKLILGKQLGAGAFGVVYKAEARGMSNAEETTVVAVKMVKKTADNMYIKALASELKIMVHLGKHINIVNLLGACTKNVGKRELIVIVEYCKFGNIHNYMQKHREVFIDQLTDNVEKNLGKVNRGFSSSTASTGVQSDYFASGTTQNTDHTFVNTANSSRKADNLNPPVETKQVSEGYIQPEWRSNYESDYIYDSRNPRPLSSRDLLVWSFQIARGMEYLANRKVLHGDLAARNILLAEDNIVKICDFGLARSIYKNDEYQKKENSPLPVKWLAIECMADRIFSTQSDVWSFGIVLWELFSLAKTPYPNIHHTNLLDWLSKGHRLERPPYADDRLYDVMMKCWLQKPNARPSFSELQEQLGTFLEDNVRNHYVDLNSMYMTMNTQQEGAQDYLDMVCAPDYNNVVTPSPHHYVNMNKSFFPSTPLPLDEDGYLQVSPACNQAIFSPRPQNATFDFDARKFNTRASEASSGGSELTPMLTLNNLPARTGSESDHEGNTFPYSNAGCPRIDEETDEVFEKKPKNVQILQNNVAVSNPTYAIDIGFDKKPKDIINNYVNMHVPNGLVK